MIQSIGNHQLATSIESYRCFFLQILTVRKLPFPAPGTYL